MNAQTAPTEAVVVTQIDTDIHSSKFGLVLELVVDGIRQGSKKIGQPLASGKHVRLEFQGGCGGMSFVDCRCTKAIDISDSTRSDVPEYAKPEHSYPTA